ncbi:sugar porter family MFS transporter [Rhodocaloribacter litoris]|uniref:sugar porter family MFS transporter n=1 Tax=Rhodocaloribacter litoris TaxID=2558931 RepID=UPI001E3112AC|nr:sugar porter family MFS transporter [Rhodocaloribacter litoris]QXD16911.1 sugar porter family MFS transporter [Rhodocaloribacter litoris]
MAVALIGTIVGAFAAGRPADRFGRRRVLFVLAALYFVSAVGSALAQTWFTFLFYRFLGGLAVGGSSVVAPMYIAEIAPAHLRGRLVAVNQLNVVTGILLAFFSNYVIAQLLDPGVAWRWMLGVEAFPAAFFFVLLFFIPFSPRWLVRQGRVDEARAVLERLGEPDVEREMAEIVTSLKEETGRQEARLFQRRYAFPIFLAWAIAMFNQLSGINALMYYAPRIFRMAGAAADDALLQAVAVGGTNLLFTIVALFIIDRFGRRPLMLAGSVGTAACLALVAWAFHTGGAMGTPVLAGLLGFIAFFAFSQGAVIWVYISEVFPNRVRSKGQSLGSFTHWFMAAAVSWTFPVVAEASGALAFAFFSAMMVLQFFFAWKVMPETKGLSLEALEVRLGAGTAELEALERQLHDTRARP